jgi:hypothetical protein
MNRRRRIATAAFAVFVAAAGVATWSAWPSATPSKPAAPGQTFGSPAASPTSGQVADQARWNAANYKNYFNGNPAFNCADGRNNGLTEKNLDKFSPCPNGMFHVTINHGVLQLISSTAPVVIRGDVDLWKRGDGDTQITRDWVLLLDIARTEAIPQDQGPAKVITYKHVAYGSGANITPFMEFVRVDGGAWDVSVNTNDHLFYTDRNYDLVFTWTDSSRPNVPAAMPFNWA